MRRPRASSHLSMMCIGIQHVRQYILGILQSLRHLSVRTLQSTRQWVRAAFSFFIDVGHNSTFTGQYYFSVVLEIHLYYFVTESEHNGMPGPHPLLNVHLLVSGRHLVLNFTFLLEVPFQIRPEVLQQCNFLLQLLGVVVYTVGRHHVLPFRSFAFYVVHHLSVFRFQYHFSRVIKEHTGSSIGQ